MDEKRIADELLLEPMLEQQREVRKTLERLRCVAEDLEQAVREELRSALAEELRMLGDSSARAAQALSRVRRAASLRIATWTIGVTLVCATVPAAVVWAVLPTGAQLARLRRERASLEASVARLESEGGRIDLRRCGSPPRLCVRVERSGPAYGAHADYLIVKDD